MDVHERDPHLMDSTTTNSTNRIGSDDADGLDWESIVRTHSARVYRLAYRLTGNRHDAEDLTQDVFVRVFRNLATYTPGTFEGWLHRITTNLFLDQVRHKRRIRFVAFADGTGGRLVDRQPTPAQALDDCTFDVDVQAALDDLSPSFRTAIVLSDVEGLSYQEIATTLGIKMGTARSRIHRGRAQLRSTLAHRAPLASPRSLAKAAAPSLTCADGRLGQRSSARSAWSSG
jgi:RNA polymerase sigma-70 factor (ECF subfamily)